MSNEEPWINIDAAKLPDPTIAEALTGIAVENCRLRDPNIRPQHVKAKLLHELNEGRLVGKAYAASSAGEPDYDNPGSRWPPISRYGDWESAVFSWGLEFYRRLARARQFKLPAETLEQRAIAFASALASLMRPLGQWCLLAGQQERSPVLNGYGGRDPLLDEPAGGRPKNVH